MPLVLQLHIQTYMECLNLHLQIVNVKQISHRSLKLSTLSPRDRLNLLKQFRIRYPQGMLERAILQQNEATPKLQQQQYQSYQMNSSNMQRLKQFRYQNNRRILKRAILQQNEEAILSVQLHLFQSLHLIPDLQCHLTLSLGPTHCLPAQLGPVPPQLSRHLLHLNE